MEGFPFVHRDQVRFRDLDAMGHVNNAVFLTYLESARTGFFVDAGLVSRPEDLPIIVARIEIDFRSPLGLGEPVEVGVRPGRLGRKSFDLEYEVRGTGRVAAEALSVCVGFDYASGATIELPQAWRKLLAA